MIAPALDLILDDGVALIDIMARIDAEDLGLTSRPRWRALVTDLARLRAGWRPDEAVLAKAPVLTGWSASDPAAHDLVQLLGTVTGHPIVADHRFVQTSPVMAIDTCGRSWARTASRFYRLQLPDTKPE